MNILVTGGAGYIGSHAAKLLQNQGHLPVVLDDLSTGHQEFVRYGPFVHGDVRDETLIRETLGQFKIDAVMHFAAKISVEESTRLPEQYFSTNVGGAISLLSAMKRAEVKRLVFSSTAAVYGEPRAELIGEDHPTHPVNPYGITKLHAEQAIRAIAPSFGLKAAFLRYFNVVGADPDGEVWEWHDPETHVLPNLLRAMGDGSPFHLYGDDYATPDGTAIRDYVNVLDLTAVHLDALARLECTGEEPFLISNVGLGTGISVKQLLSLAETVFGKRVDARVSPRRSGDPPRLVADNAFLKTWSEAWSSDFRPMKQTLRELKAISGNRRETDPSPPEFANRCP